MGHGVGHHLADLVRNSACSRTRIHTDVRTDLLDALFRHGPHDRVGDLLDQVLAHVGDVGATVIS